MMLRDGEGEIAARGVPARLDADRTEHVEDPLDLDDAGHVAQRGAAAVEQGRAQQRHRRVLRRLHRHAALERVTARHAQVGGAGADADQLAVQRRRQPAEQLEGEVLPALLDPGDGALAGPEPGGQLLLGEPPVTPGIADERADPVGRGHGRRVGQRHASTLSRR